MTRESKQRLLDIFDSLVLIANERQHCCGVCGGDQRVWVLPQHTPDCVVGRALANIQPAIPAQKNREAWLSA